ncbi:MAG: MgtC/SapB family protein [Rhizomicrobium sp.]
MDTYALLERLLLALAIGLLIGVERGWREREGKEGSRAAGVRTYALIGLLGGVCALLVSFVGNFFLGSALLAFAGSLALFEWREAHARNSASATGMIAGLVAFVLGAYAALGDMVVAGASGIAATVILAEREALHTFVENLKWSELRAALLLLVMTFVLLPLLPNHPVDPWGALNPRQLWLMMVIIAALSYVGYICIRLAGDRAGLIYAAAAGGLVSSTTVTWTYARLGRAQPNSSLPLAAGVTTSWAVSLMRMCAIATALTPALAWPLAKILGLPVALLIGVTLLMYRRSETLSQKSPLVLTNPFELSEVLKFGLLLAAVTLVAKLAGTGTNQLGLIPLAAVSGLVDVDPITLSTARIAGQTITLPYAAIVIVVAGGANLLCKTVLAVTLGSRPFAVYVAAVSLATAASATALWAVLT